MTQGNPKHDLNSVGESESLFKEREQWHLQLQYNYSPFLKVELIPNLLWFGSSKNIKS